MRCWHEVSVHDVHVDAVGPGLLSLSDLLTKPGEVRGEDRRSQLHCAFGHFGVILFCFHEWRLDDGVKPRNEKTVGVRQRHSLGSRNRSTSFPNWTARLKSR